MSAIELSAWLRINGQQGFVNKERRVGISANGDKTQLVIGQPTVYRATSMHPKETLHKGCHIHRPQMRRPTHDDNI